jgi:Schlafen, AlbA_2
MQTGQLQLEELIQKIQRHNEASYRIILKKEEETYALLTALVDISPEPQTPAWSLADYGRYVFLAGKLSAEDLFQCIRGRRGQLGDYVFSIPEMPPTASWAWFPSHTRYGGVTALRLPHTSYQISPANPSFRGSNSAFLIGDDCPSFSNLDMAAFRLLYDAEWEPGQEMLNTLWLIRVTHTEAWIEHLRLSPSSIAVTIAGSDVKDSRLEVIGSIGNDLSQRLTEAGTIEWRLPKGLPSRLRLMLSRDGAYLDYRDLKLHGRPSQDFDSVDIEQSANLGEQIQGLVSRGENESVEFKQQISSDKGKFIKTVAAFANGNGGVILFGVDDDGTIIGVTGDVSKLKDDVVRMVRDNVVPKPKVRIEDCAIDAKTVLALYVEQGDKHPYGINPAKPVFYIRRGANSFPASQEEIRDFVLANHNVAPSTYNHLLSEGDD